MSTFKQKALEALKDNFYSARRDEEFADAFNAGVDSCISRIEAIEEDNDSMSCDESLMLELMPVRVDKITEPTWRASKDDCEFFAFTPNDALRGLRDWYFPKK